ncbi:hypothetical protein GCM10009789_33130 [Kribbella sancticallisti]|uniref:DUF4259 domain-containing protein n=1 Tax=Kribbella sancticallisti TaxID=460087 RepID=A0ABN2DH68_9ACTN
MGTWDPSVFGNDEAADWAGELAENGTVTAVEQLLTTIAGYPLTEYLEVGTGSSALAAAEVVAAAIGKPTASTPYNKEVLEWATRHPELESLRSVARAAAERVRTPESELLEVWEEEEVDTRDREAWENSVADLVTRLL